MKTRYGHVPRKTETDSAYATKLGVTQTTQQGAIPVSSISREDQLKAHGKDPYQRQKGDTDEYEAFRQRMLEPENFELCKQRPPVAEFANADCRNRGLQQFNVRGLAKVQTVAL